MKTIDEIEKTNINYRELAFIMNEDALVSKHIFELILPDEKITKQELPVSELAGYFGKVSSIDKRYDGMNSLVFNMIYKSKSYRKFLNLKTVIRKGKFTGGKSIFHKIMSSEDCEHFKLVVAHKRAFLRLNNE